MLLPARDFYQWVEYCNAPAGLTTLSKLRESGGDRDPFNVRYWGIGNEAWGCGGHFSPEDYAAEYKRFATFLKSFTRAPGRVAVPVIVALVRQPLKSA